MYNLNNYHDKPYKKSARIVGDCLGRYHPHGDMALYDALVRMAQTFSMRYALIDGQGNFGSVDGDSPAHMRYTEVRLQRLAEEMLADIEKETVDFVPNFDNTLKEPVVLPTKIPNLIINGSSGIAVGMATSIPPHNLREVVDALIAMIDGGGEEEVLRIIQGPDFPTGGEIVGRAGILEAYKTGRGIIRIRGKCEIDAERHTIHITEIPYQITKVAIIEAIAEAVKNKKIEGIRGVHDRSDKEGIDVLIELSKDANPEIVMNQLYSFTPLESTLGIINLVLVRNEPKILSLYQLLNEFLSFRKEIIRRRCLFDLKVSEERAHILEGLKKALEHIDSVVALLKGAKDVESARNELMANYNLTEKQANAILDMKLQRLIALERKKLEEEYDELRKTIEWLKDVLGDERKIMEIIKNELNEIKQKYGDERRTKIIEVESERTVEELIPDEEVVVIISARGYIKRIPLTEYRAQHRGGKGIIGAETREEDVVQDIIVTRNHNYILFFTDHGRLFWLKAYEIPEASRYATGKPIVNLLQLQDEKVTSLIAVKEFSENEFFFMVTKRGIVKRVSLINFSNPRKTGIIAITLKEGDQLVNVIKTDGRQEVLIATKLGQAIRFNEEEAREIGRTAQGVIGIRLDENDEVVGLTACNKPTILTITENGYGKRTELDEYRVQGRGGYGVINIKTEGRNGHVVGVEAVDDSDEIIVMSSKGKAIRIPVKDISIIGRNTQGVRIIKLEEGEKVASFAVIKKEKEAEASL
jgi:DNA gyrase subunit A